MKEITKEMFYLWDMKEMDWLGYEIDNFKTLQFHHIIPKSDGGKLEIKNGSVLIPNSHCEIHLIQQKDYDRFIYLTNILKSINEQGFMPVDRQLFAIDDLMSGFEKEYCALKTAKGNDVIKEEYTRRLVRTRKK